MMTSPRLSAKVADEPCAIRVIAQDRSIFLGRQRVDGACVCGPGVSCEAIANSSDLMGTVTFRPRPPRVTEVAYARLETPAA